MGKEFDEQLPAIKFAHQLFGNEKKLLRKFEQALKWEICYQ